MALYCGIDLHSNNHVVGIIDDEDRRIVNKRLPNDLVTTLSVLEPYRSELVGVAVESTYNWYWLVDGLMDHGYELHLVNTAAVPQYSGLKHSDDPHDAWWLAHLMRLGILPTGAICPRPMRSLRDLMRRRMALVQDHTRHVTALQCVLARETGRSVSLNELRQDPCSRVVTDSLTGAGIEAQWQLIGELKHTIASLDKRIRRAIRPDERYRLLQTMPGVGFVLAATIVLETGDIRRFRRVGNYSSYCRCVATQRTSNGKTKGTGNRRCGNRYLSWAYAEAAHFARRYDARSQRFFDRKAARRNPMVAARALAHKLARAAYFMLRERQAFDAARLFG